MKNQMFDGSNRDIFNYSSENEQKPREKIFSGQLTELNDEELLSVVLGRGVVGKNVFDLAKEVALLLKKCSRMPKIEDLLPIHGMGRTKAAQVLACLELSNRFMMGHQDLAVQGPAELMPRIAFLKSLTQERMVLVCLNGGNRVIGIHTLTVGLANQAPVHPREAFAPALVDRAVGVIFAHDHPSGNLEPSVEDCQVTRRLCEVGRLLDVPVLDHIIVSIRGFRSLKASHPDLFD